MKAKKSPILLILLVVITIGAFGAAVVSGTQFFFQEGLQGLLSGDVMGFHLNQKQVANLSAFLVMPFAFGGMLLAVYHWSCDVAMNIFKYAALLVGIIGGTLNYFFMLLLSISLIFI